MKNSKTLQKEYLFFQMIEESDHIFCLANEDFSEIFYVNPAYEKLWGKKIGDLYTKPLSLLESVHVLDQENVKIDYKNLIKEGILSNEYRIIRDGEVRWIKTCAHKIKDPVSHRSYIVFMSQDETDFKNLEEKNTTQLQQLEQKNAALKELFSMLQNHRAENEEKVRSELKNIVFPLINQLKLAHSYQPKLIQRLQNAMNSFVENSTTSPPTANLDHLSSKEKEVANLIRMGHSTKEISQLLNLSEHTIMTYRYRIRTKCGIKSHKVPLSHHLRK